MNKRINTTTLPDFLSQQFAKTIGFDSVFNQLSESASNRLTTTYPPYNIIHEDDNKYIIELAVAGLNIDDIKITQNQNELIIIGEPTVIDDENLKPVYLHQGISQRKFTRTFALADHVIVNGAEMKDGILIIRLTREIPEELKPRVISITSN